MILCISLWLCYNDNMLKVRHGCEFVLAAGILFAAIFTGNHNFAHAETSIDTALSVDSSLTFSVTPRNTEVVLSPDSGGNYFARSSDVTVTVGTNNLAGYEVIISSEGTDLVNTADGTKTIPTLPELSGGYTEDTFVVNSWGYKQDSGNYVPFVSGTTLMNSNTSTVNDTTKLVFAAKANSVQASGTYAISLNFELVIKPLP